MKKARDKSSSTDWRSRATEMQEMLESRIDISGKMYKLGIKSYKAGKYEDAVKWFNKPMEIEKIVRRPLEREQMKAKICLLGDLAVGKTSLIRRFVYDFFDDKYIPTMGTKVSHKGMVVQDLDRELEVNLDLLIWDIMGYRKHLKAEASFFKPRKQYFQGAKGALLVCDLTRKLTLEHFEEWVSLLFDEAGEVPIIVLANKHDLSDQHVFGAQELDKVASAHGASWLFTSAKTGKNVDKAFYSLGRSLIKSLR